MGAGRCCGGVLDRYRLTRGLAERYPRNRDVAREVGVELLPARPNSAYRGSRRPREAAAPLPLVQPQSDAERASGHATLRTFFFSGFLESLIMKGVSFVFHRLWQQHTVRNQLLDYLVE